jgi:hypothetical protein
MRTKTTYTIFLSAVIFLWIGCAEEPPFINYEKPKTTIDTTWVKAEPAAPQQKQVMLEDFTGVRCVNCPDAAKIAKDLQTLYPGRVNVAAIHPLNLLNTFTDPIDKDGHKSRQDFRTQAGTDICRNLLGVPNSLPKGAVDRVKFSDQIELLIDYTVWTPKVTEQLAVPTPVNIGLTNVPSPPNEVVVDVRLEYTKTLTDTNYITLMIIEDSIVDVQQYINRTDPQNPYASYNNNYVHMHVMRDVMSASTGDLLNAPLVAGRVFLKRYKYTITNTNWQRKHLQVIAFVHRNGNDKTILQSNHVKIE